jgi:hypothetical protein
MHSSIFQRFFLIFEKILNKLIAAEDKRVTLSSVDDETLTNDIFSLIVGTSIAVPKDQVMHHRLTFFNVLSAEDIPMMIEQEVCYPVTIVDWQPEHQIHYSSFDGRPQCLIIVTVQYKRAPTRT